MLKKKSFERIIIDKEKYWRKIWILIYTIINLILINCNLYGIKYNKRDVWNPTLITSRHQRILIQTGELSPTQVDVLRKTLITDLSGRSSIGRQQNLLRNKLDNDPITKKLMERGILKTNITEKKEIKIQEKQKEEQ
ncbi:putative exported protein, partial [Plasmodium gaboni]